MSWHSKRHNIKHKKWLQDAKKSKVYWKIWKIIQLAAKWWENPSLNPVLQSALDRAKVFSVPKDIIERAIKKWSWQWTQENIQEILYEWYWPGGCWILIKTITDNNFRTASNVRAILERYWWKMAERWSVIWMFEQKSYFFIDWIVEIKFEKWKNISIINPLDLKFFENEILNLEILDYEIFEDWIDIFAEKSKYIEIKNNLEKLKFNINESCIEYVPNEKIDLDENSYKKFETLLEALEEDDDIDIYFSNVN